MTDGDYNQTLGIIRSLGQKGIQVTAITKSTSDLGSFSRYCCKTEIAPGPAEAGYVEAVLGILRRNSYYLLIPVGYAATESLARRREAILALTRLELVDYEQIRLAADKRYVCDLAASLGIPVPRTIYPETWEDIARCSGALEYPLVIKPLRESAGNTVCHVRTASELVSAYREFCQKRGYIEGNLPMLQEYIPGHGCGFFALYQDGACRRIFMHRRIRENPPSGGASTCAESFYDAKLKEYGIRLQDRLRWHGVVMVEFRYDVRVGDYKLLEVNPKFWGSLDLALAAGVDFPYYLCQMAQGNRLDYSEEYEKNLRYHWPLSGEIPHLLRRPSSLGAVLLDTINPHVKSNLWMRDLDPSLHEVVSLVRSAWGSIFRG